uniref:W2 domain-containing protein n=1 Tax=Chromera velia CCMP2878 TaxID=1169474 RepID=A0A0G4I000_9ALVE|mmetsp:Transcript_31090/g.61299  ORF Transcript_31090/g.61299 Transcript_31090/m.61299 type:complete len:549 (-) Transcript_31090:219-1865(-)|eukprot:Cvel_1603.t1-p1 / transcript=Cvel_1603.t1 / gene=Cvel_1603 / organism=Chromera_velia_CCMP2878 / gene_product=Eukaryotic translation initiation factor 5, putative / transcript_product=Eukaryotic translation initiation factor 5, putative / location=Cvel_scaffold57:90875-93088(-) / protein_length=548 / sequence_SO=supercontig / SO=protein_coding / is_pseudo=false
MINIPSTKDDPNYRYKMPKLVAKIEGRGNGIKTNIVNMADIARSLKRPPSYTTKWFGCELGAQSNWFDKEEKAIVNGAHNQAELADILDKFIAKYVLCPNCELPEIDLVVSKGGMISCKCNACGHRGDLDSAHRLAVFIAKNPPDGSDGTMGKKSKKTKEERAAERAAKQRADAGLGDGSDVEEEDEKAKKKKKKKDKAGDEDAAGDEKKAKKDKKEKKEKKEKKAKKTSSEGSDDAGDEETHAAASTEGTTKKKKKGKKDKEVDDEGVMTNERLSFTSAEIIDVVARIQSTCKEYIATTGSLGVDEFFQEVRLLQVAQDFDSRLRFFVVLCALFGSDPKDGEKEKEDEEGLVFTIKAVKSKMNFVKRVVDKTLSPDSLLQALEAFCFLHRPGAFQKGPKAPATLSLVVKELYDEDVLSEKAIMKFYKPVTSKELEAETKERLAEGVTEEEEKILREGHLQGLEAVKPLLEWFAAQSDDSDDDDDEDDEDEEEETGVVNGPAKKSLGTRGGGAKIGNGAEADGAGTSASTPAQMEVDSGEEDVDIDDI